MHLHVEDERLQAHTVYEMCSLTTERVLLPQNVFSYHRMCSLTTECVF